MKTAFCSVIFPNNEKYFNVFLKSLEQQTDTNFTLLLFNDGVQNIDHYLRNLTIKVEVIEVQGSITEIRTFLLEYLKKSSFDTVIFGDTDDFFSKNRVEVSKCLLKDYDVVGTDLNIVSSNGSLIQERYWNSRTETKEDISIASILDYNFLGLGNTAIKKTVLPANCTFPKSLTIIDWYLFSLILINNPKVCFTSKATVNYRQHNQNLIGRKEVNLEDFKDGFLIKLNHYKYLANENNVFKEKYEFYNSKKELVKQLALFTFEVENNNPFWWEEINIDKL